MLVLRRIEGAAAHQALLSLTGITHAVHSLLSADSGRDLKQYLTHLRKHSK